MSVAQKLKFSIRPNPAPVAADVRAGLLKDPGFGRVFTDHMVTIRWTQDAGWQDAQLRAPRAESRSIPPQQSCITARRFSKG